MFEDIAEHHFGGFGDDVEIVEFIEFIPAVEDVVYGFNVFGGVANLPIDYAGLVHEQIMVDEDVLGSQIQSISAEVVQLVDVDAVDLVADQLELPRASLVWLAADQRLHPIYF